MHKDKVQYTKHHLLRNIIRQQAAKAKVRSVACFVVSHMQLVLLFPRVAKQLREAMQATLYTNVLRNQWPRLIAIKHGRVA